MTEQNASPHSAAVQEYLEAMLKLERRDGRIRQVALSRRLGVSPSSVGTMIRRMEDQGLVERGPDGHVLLTEAGRLEASKMVRRHRLAERFLVDILGLPWHGVHEEACRLEHALSDESEERMEQLLNNPETCPHGHPIPRRDGDVAHLPGRLLSDVRPGERCCISCVMDEDSEHLRYLATLGLLPGVDIVVEERAPFNGPVMVRVGRALYALGREVASKIEVTECDEHHRHHHHHRHHGRGGWGHGGEVEIEDGDIGDGYHD